MVKRSLWATPYGFYLAAIGSAFGLGNLWRFPYVVAENGGGAFVLLYGLLAFSIGLPLLVAELVLGKLSRRGIVVALDEIGLLNPATMAGGPLSGDPRDRLTSRSRFSVKRSWVWVGRLALLVCFLILSYYAVISGWVLFHLYKLVLGVFRPATFSSQGTLEVLRGSGLLQVGLASLHMLAVIVIVLKGVHNGIEKWVSYMMPLFAGLLVWLMMYSLSLPDAGAALRFLFYPDFSKLNLSSLGQALGHIFFTLSIGFGTMVTFGSYLPDKAAIPAAGFRVTLFDTMISLCAGLLIFPMLIMQPGGAGGPEVLFLALPKLFETLGYTGLVFGSVFFISLYLAALSASLGLMETVVSNLVDRWGRPRKLATWYSGFAVLLVAVIPALSSTLLQHLRLGERGLLEILDAGIINWLLPLAALGLSVAVGFALNEELSRKEFFVGSQLALPRVYRDWRVILRWLAPAIILLALALQIAELFVG